MDGAEVAGRLVFLVAAVAGTVAMMVVGQRRKKETGGERGQALFVSGLVLLVLVVLGTLGQAAQVSTAP